MLRRNNNEKGFTLIELILVIVILGILSAVALPRFVDLQGDAQQARNQGVLAALSGSITMLHGQFLINGASSDYDATAVLANTDIQGESGSAAGAAAITVSWPDGLTHTYTYTPRNNATGAAGAVQCATADCS